MLNHQPPTIALDRQAHQWANQFAAQHTTPSKRQQVYLNTLAVCAVRQYLSQTCAIDLDLSQSDSWHIGPQTLMNIADLLIPQVGKLECRPIPPGGTMMYIPPEIHSPDPEPQDRIGYVAVQFAEDLNTAELIGFMANPTTPWVFLDQLDPLEALLDTIYAQEKVQIAKLRDLLTQQWGTWEPIDSLIPRLLKLCPQSQQENYQVTLRNLTTSQVAAGKIINLQANIANIPLLLLLGLNQEADGRIKVKPRLHSAGQTPTLPANIKLELQNSNGECLREVCYDQAMDFIQLQSFKLSQGTEFKIQISLDHCSLTEAFIA
jgi:hypothetical protein